MLTTPRHDYVRLLAESYSAQDRRRLQDAMQGTLSFNSFPSENIELETFDWSTGSENRNWWWQLQQLPVNRWYVNSFDASSDESHHQTAQRFLLRVLQNWDTRSVESRGEIPLTWHDHAAALRLRGLRDLYVALQAVQASDNALAIELESQIEKHCLWLEDSENYSRRTNHGFDQSDILLSTALLFPDWQHADRLVRVGRSRLIDELNFAFTHEGVHKENSPGYHQFMMTRLEQLLDYKKFGDPELAQTASQYFENSRRFLGAIALPDETLPPIGDTRLGTQVKPEYVNAESQGLFMSTPSGSELQIHDFAESGYLVVDYKDERTDEIGKLILKSGQFSHYHRQDDDLSIYWSVGNRVLLDDAGLYSHNETDPVRIYARSSHAHNTLIVSGSTPTRNNRASGAGAPLQIKTDPLRLVATTSYIQHWKLRRVVNIDKLAQGRLVVECQANSTLKSGSLITNWIVSPRFSVSQLDTSTGRVVFRDETACSLTISPEDPALGCVLYAGKGSSAENTAVTSSTFGEYESTLRLATRWNGPGSLRNYLNFDVP